MWGGLEPNCWLNLTLFFLYSNKKYFQFNFSKFQGAIWKLFTQEFQDRSYFLEYMVLRITKLSLNLSTYRWDTLYKDKRKTEKKHTSFHYRCSLLNGKNEEITRAFYIILCRAIERSCICLNLPTFSEMVHILSTPLTTK